MYNYKYARIIDSLCTRPTYTEFISKYFKEWFPSFSYDKLPENGEKVVVLGSQVEENTEELIYLVRSIFTGNVYLIDDEGIDFTNIKDFLCPGMNIQLKNGIWYFVSHNKESLIKEKNYRIPLKSYDSNLSHIEGMEQWDISSVVINLNGTTWRIWERKKVDWSKVPKDTRVFVRDSTDKEWKKAHFALYDKGTFYAYQEGMSSWTADEIYAYRYCKLAK